MWGEYPGGKYPRPILGLRRFYITGHMQRQSTVKSLIKEDKTYRFVTDFGKIGENSDTCGQ